MTRETITDDNFLGTVTHSKGDLYSGIWATSSQKVGSVYLPLQVTNYAGPLGNVFAQEMSPGLSQLNWNKVASSNQFSIIQFVAELDDTLAIFTKKFWNSLSYGSISWGLIPFVNDVKAILTQISNMPAVLNGHQPYSDQLSLIYTKDYNYLGGIWEARGAVKIQHTGSIWVDTSFVGRAKQLLDILGLHPDIGTAWDLVPLSFVVDWFLPVGDLLSQTYDRGWVDTAAFEGWISAKVMQEFRLKRFPSSEPYGPNPSILMKSKYYTRWYGQQSLQTERPQLEQYQGPSLHELFNTWYVLFSQRRR